MSNVVIVGKINGVYGIKGWLKIFSYTDPKENILHYTPWLIHGQPVELEEGKPQGKTILAKLKGIDDRNQAMAFLQTDILIQREQLPSLPTGEFYWSDLIGLRVINEQGIDLGSISELFDTSAHEVIVIKNQHGERLIPLVWNDIVKHIDLEQGHMRVRWEADY